MVSKTVEDLVEELKREFSPRDEVRLFRVVVESENKISDLTYKGLTREQRRRASSPADEQP